MLHRLICLYRSPDGFGNINYSSPPGAVPPFVNIAGGRNGVSLDSANFIVLGQEVGAAGDPAALLSFRDIPMDEFRINFNFQNDASVSINDFSRGMIQLDCGTAGAQVPFGIITDQGRSPGSNPYGNFWHTLDQGFVNPDGQVDAVYQWGYNQTGNGGVVVSNECEVHYAIESHFQQGGIGTGQMEVHLQSTAKNGDINRHFSYDIQCDNGQTNAFSQVDAFSWQGTQQSGIGEYMRIGNDGTLTVVGTVGQIDLGNGTESLQLAPIPGFGYNIAVSGATPAILGLANSVAIIPNLAAALDIRNGAIPSDTTTGIAFSGNKTVAYQLFTSGPFIDFDGGVSASITNSSANANGFASFGLAALKTTGVNYPLLAFTNSSTGTGWATGSPLDDSYRIQWNNSFDYLNGVPAINIDTDNRVTMNDTAVEASAILNLVSTSMGFLPPRMTTTQKNAIAAPVVGLTVYDTILNKLSLWTGASWETVTSI